MGVEGRIRKGMESIILLKFNTRNCVYNNDKMSNFYNIFENFKILKIIIKNGIIENDF